jgi:hypothetical protein
MDGETKRTRGGCVGVTLSAAESTVSDVAGALEAVISELMQHAGNGGSLAGGS